MDISDDIATNIHDQIQDKANSMFNSYFSTQKGIGRNQVLIDENSFSYLDRLLPQNYQSERVMVFLRFLLLTESLVLHNAVYLPIRDDSSKLLRSLDKYADLADLENNNLLKFVLDSYSLEGFDEIFDYSGMFGYDYKKLADDPLEEAIWEKIIEDFDFIDCALCAIDNVDVSLSTDPNRWFSYYTKLSAPYSKSFDSDKKAYFQACKSLYNELKKLAYFGRPVSIFLPPISTLVLNDILYGHDNYIEAILTYRDKYVKVRSYFEELDEIIEDQDLSIEKSLKAQSRIIERLNALTKTYPQLDKTAVAGAFPAAKLIENLFEPEEIIKNPTKIINHILSIPIRKIFERFSYRRIHFLFLLMQKYRRIEHFNSLIEEFTGIQINPSITTEISKYIKFQEEKIVEQYEI